MKCKIMYNTVFMRKRYVIVAVYDDNDDNDKDNNDKDDNNDDEEDDQEKESDEEQEQEQQQEKSPFPRADVPLQLASAPLDQLGRVSHRPHRRDRTCNIHIERLQI